jgi:DNA-binding GntR family transcriptional regulator
VCVEWTVVAEPQSNRSMTQRKLKDASNAVPVASDAWVLPPQRSLPEVVAERLVEAIRSGALRPGERLVETALAGKLRVSRGPLREALKALEANHLVESRRGRGTYVREVTPDEVAQMVGVRALLEGLAARLVATTATQAIIQNLQRLHRRIEAAARAGETAEWRDLDWSFHELICIYSGNAFLLASWRSISNLVRVYLHQHPGYVTDVDSILGNHVAFLKAIAAKDPDRAEAVFRTTILITGFARLGREVPDNLRVYLDHSLDVRGGLPRDASKPRRGEAKERRTRRGP